MSERAVTCTYFEQTGRENTDRTLEIAGLGGSTRYPSHYRGKHNRRGRAKGRPKAENSQSTGDCGNTLRGVCGAQHRNGPRPGLPLRWRRPPVDGATRSGRPQPGRRAAQAGSYQLDEIVAFVLRSFSQGVKVACETTMMAADAGLVPVGETIIAIAGAGRGADTAAVILSANARTFLTCAC